MNHLDRAALAFRTAISMAPGLINAHRWLVAIYRRTGTAADQIAGHQRAIAELQEKRSRAAAA
jgi:hypothetical protein